MTTEIPSSSATGQPAPPAPEFTMRFTSTPRGARLARRLASQRLESWGHPYGTRVNDEATLIVAELAGNAVRHGHVPGRDFRLRLELRRACLRVEVTDTRAERLPPRAVAEPPPSAESGRGLWLVSQLALRWGIATRADGPGKTVWAEVGT
ncbi:ATP-binding protein [Streptomyces sp. NPDC047108]|uniref:ATP-binding protein n=1 Tax=Streptomyces sp. NPDC047108 TaxID=3155025 RepID=UPI00341047AA